MTLSRSARQPVDDRSSPVKQAIWARRVYPFRVDPIFLCVKKNLFYNFARLGGPGRASLMAFTYKEDELYAENVKISDLVATADTPVYCYSLTALRNNFDAYKQVANGLICFAVKSNANLSILRAIAELGGGADVVSEGEIRLALAAGIPPHKIIFSGVGKKTSEIVFAFQQNIHQINAECLDEVELIDEIAGNLRTCANVAIRLNPDIDGEINTKNTTGLAVNKFGIPLELAKEIDLKRMRHVRFVGVSCHIGSGIGKLEIFVRLLDYLKRAACELKALGWPIKRLDIGGGLGISYSHAESFPTISEYVELINENLRDCSDDYQIICEPGRSIVANTAILVTRVLYVKQHSCKTHVIVDAGMNDLIRPAMYGCLHQIIPVVRDADAVTSKVDIVGPVCETGDTFASDYEMQELHSGDLLAICDAGAYGMSLSSNYNARPTSAEILVVDTYFDVIRERETYQHLLTRSKISQKFFV